MARRLVEELECQHGQTLVQHLDCPWLTPGVHHFHALRVGMRLAEAGDAGYREFPTFVQSVAFRDHRRQ